MAPMHNVIGGQRDGEDTGEPATAFRNSHAPWSPIGDARRPSVAGAGLGTAT
jgi:hypothetical protein